VKNVIRKVSPTVIAVTLTAILLGGVFLSLGWQHTNNKIESNQHKSDQRWCTLLQQIKFPRTTAAGQKFNAALTELEQEFGCHVS
jgi:hypothetical protein